MEAHRLRSELLRGAATSRPSAPRLMFMLLVPGWRLDDRHRATEHEARRAADLFCLGGSGDSRPSLCQLSDPGGIRRRQRPGVAGLGIRLGLLERLHLRAASSGPGCREVDRSPVPVDELDLAGRLDLGGASTREAIALGSRLLATVCWTNMENRSVVGCASSTTNGPKGPHAEQFRAQRAEGSQRGYRLDRLDRAHHL
jgi:hypothetical protein